MKKKTIIIAIVTIVLAIAGAIFGITYTDEDIKEISEGVEVVVDIVEEAKNQSTIEIPEGYITDEQNLEEQEVESEGFELQGEIAYNGTSEIPSIAVGEYAGLTYYSQIDSRWKDVTYTSTGNKSQTIGSSGCGPTCGAMVVSSIKGTITPEEIAKIYIDYGYRSANHGTYWSAFRFTADVFDIEYTEKVKLAEVYDLVDENWMAIVSCSNGLFTTGGHFILIYGWQDENGNGICEETDTLKIFDPYLYSGKFNTSTRRGKVIVDGNTVYCPIKNFREYANYSKFFCYKNTHKEEQKAIISEITTEPYVRYVSVRTSLNVRSGPSTSYKYVKSLYDGNSVTIYEEKGNWARIGDGQWVCTEYLTDHNIKSTVGQVKRFKGNTTLYSNSNLTGKTYQYLPNTSVAIVENVSLNVDKVRVRKTGRTAYVSTNSYK